MKTNSLNSILLSFLISVLPNQYVDACSMYKITVDNKTMVGSNQDAWRTTTCIWFKNPQNPSEYGACFTGSRKVGPNIFVPQSGMNTEGLVFSRLVAYHPEMDVDLRNKKPIRNEVDYLTKILQSCRTIEDVRQFIEAYDYSIFIDDVYIYIDQSGDYLIVEPYQMIKGNDPTYVLANFCPSITTNQNARLQERYKNGEDYLKANTVNTSLEFCRSMSDTMSVCRDRNGDGTLLTSIWDTDKGLVNLYFYHSFDQTKQFNISEELKKGDHLISIPELFPVNQEFERLKSYKTPFNTPILRVTLVLLGGVLLILSAIYFISFIRRFKQEQKHLIKLSLALINAGLFYYMFILATNINIYYFSAPYYDYSSKIVTYYSYMPLLLLLVIGPIIYYSIKYVKQHNITWTLKSIMTLNIGIYILLIGAFSYWGLYDLFG